MSKRTSPDCISPRGWTISIVVSSDDSAHRFAVRLIEPRKKQKYEQSLRAEALVELPEGSSLERGEFWLNETLVATLYQEPFTQPIVLPPAEEIAYVRAVAYQADGNSTEDLVFVNAPENLEELDVQFVELFTTVLDRDSRPVADLPEAEFTVREDGVPQPLSRFEKVENLPVHMAVLLDTSASMEPNLDDAKQAALKLFEEAVQPRDRAALIPFNDRPTLQVKLTNRVADLAGGLAGMKAERGTSLYDAVVFSLFYFNGVKGQRAILVLSDGKDENSRFTFDQTLDFARRAGVAIYTIGLGIGRTEFDTRKVLNRLSDETGGRAFYMKEVAELGPIYAAIQKELRSRYLLAYQSTNTSPEQKFRTVEVEVARSGLEAKTMRGYYP
ncbi:MAG: VWA domain-containing protein [Thermoanaerobaculia bacterium]|nr:VWA domain-containing protein [Thermoanaerobaculia bacterium]